MPGSENMYKIKEIAITKERVIALVKFLLMTGLIALVPFFNIQTVTGPLVNAILFISVVILGINNAVFIGLIPSVISLMSGLLPVVISPVVPFIMISNAILVLVFGYFYFQKGSYWWGVILASIFKFIFLLSTSSLVINLVVKKEIASKISLMMSWPQLFTALAGGLIAYIFLKSIKKLKV